MSPRTWGRSSLTANLPPGPRTAFRPMPPLPASPTTATPLRPTRTQPNPPQSRQPTANTSQRQLLRPHPLRPQHPGQVMPSRNIPWCLVPPLGQPEPPVRRRLRSSCIDRRKVGTDRAATTTKGVKGAGEIAAGETGTGRGIEVDRSRPAAIRENLPDMLQHLHRTFHRRRPQRRPPPLTLPAILKAMIPFNPSPGDRLATKLNLNPIPPPTRLGDTARHTPPRLIKRRSLSPRPRNSPPRQSLRIHRRHL
jgi:hypothetical protein